MVRFHEATSPFTVERDLRVKIVAKRRFSPYADIFAHGSPAATAFEKQRQKEEAAPVRPGDQVEVTVTTTDAQGKP